jgi:hypothetical protein
LPVSFTDLIQVIKERRLQIEAPQELTKRGYLFNFYPSVIDKTTNKL